MRRFLSMSKDNMLNSILTLRANHRAIGSVHPPGRSQKMQVFSKIHFGVYWVYPLVIKLYQVIIHFFIFFLGFSMFLVYPDGRLLGLGPASRGPSLCCAGLFGHRSTGARGARRQVVLREMGKILGRLSRLMGGCHGMPQFMANGTILMINCDDKFHGILGKNLPRTPRFCMCAWSQFCLRTPQVLLNFSYSFTSVSQLDLPKWIGCTILWFGVYFDFPVIKSFWQGW